MELSNINKVEGPPEGIPIVTDIEMEEGYYVYLFFNNKNIGTTNN